MWPSCMDVVAWTATLRPLSTLLVVSATIELYCVVLLSPDIMLHNSPTRM
eukprot:CAMPEP_0113707964 /NCGR_PEP_ID=MMETSP0038_2-20120614/28706_1 /TAXON_ID=2898 /ORGANISM="Cryptomonas paramecium" /LENGTH=49 /DNA_ID=CAMNT_0000633593 /DNA_START=590 /DNA_END=739 /DNA_ORIENTATION=- /assembly_acc=CAM_ASM_000170